MDKEDEVYIHTHTHTHTRAQEYYSTVTMNKIMPFAATRMDLEIIILSEVNQTDIVYQIYDITYMWNLKYDTNELIYETETDSQTLRTDRRLPWGRGWSWR